MSKDDEEVSSRVLTVPNAITAVRFCLIPVFAWLFVTGEHDGPALAVGFTLGSTDWVDGFVARRTGQVSKLGKILDPIVDRFAIITVILLFSFRGTIYWPLAAAILLRDLLASVVFIVLEARGFPRIAVNLVGKTATALIYLGSGFAIASLAFGTSLEEKMYITSTACLTVGAILYWIALLTYFVQIPRMRRERPAV